MSDFSPFGPGQTIAGRYQLGEILGTGMLGTVYEAQDSTTGQAVALKVFRPDLLRSDLTAESFRNSVLRANQVEHQGVLKLSDAGAEGDHFFYCTALVRTRTLRAILDEQAGAGSLLPPSRARQVTRAILDVLVAAHDVGVHHSNLKPENILVHEVDKDGAIQTRVAISEFGVAAIIDGARHDEVYGGRSSNPYMAPEQTASCEELGAAVDSYSIGVMLYQMLTNEVPVGEFELPSTINDELPNGVDDLIELALNPLPGNRLHSAQGFLDALGSSFADTHTGRSLPMKAIGILGVIAVLAAGAAFYFGQKEPPTDAELATLRMEAIDEIRASIGEAASSPEDLRNQYAGMVYVPGGKFLYGDLGPMTHEHIRDNADKLVGEVDGFWIDRYEYPNSDPNSDEIKKLIAEKTARGENGESVLVPSAHRNHNAATDMCSEDGKRLCTAPEWERACRGPTNALYAYGDSYDSSKCPDPGMAEDGGYKNGDFPNCKSGWDVYGMGGGLFEWTASTTSGKRIVKDGALGDAAAYTHCGYGGPLSPINADQHTGFRCCRSE